MEITLVGYIFVIAGMIAFFLSHRFLYAGLVFFVPFSATAIINFSSGFWLTPFQYFGCLLILSEIFRAGVSGNIRIPNSRSLLFLFLFVCVVFASLIMPILIDGSLKIQSPRLNEPGSKSLYFTVRNLTAALYIAFGAVITFLVAKRNRHYWQIVSTIKIYVLSGFFVALWGIWEFVLTLIGAKYPVEIFNNVTNKIAHGHSGVILGLSGEVINRISSVTIEPSVLSQFLLSVLPFIVFSCVFRQSIITPNFDRLIGLVLTSALLLSTSASAYVGLTILFFLSLYVLFRTMGLRIKYVVYSLGIPIISVVIFLTNPDIQGYLNLFVFDKLASGSGNERLISLQYAWGYFQEYPILGVGWGSVTSHDLILKLLSSLGVIGLASFLLLMYYVLGGIASYLRWSGKRKNKTNRNVTSTELAVIYGVFVSNVLLFFLQLFTEFNYGLGHFWFLFGLAISCRSFRVFPFKETILGKASLGARVSGSEFGRHGYL